MNRNLIVALCWLFLAVGVSAQSGDTLTLVVSPMAPVFAQPSEASEQVTQVLYGDEVRVSDSQGAWIKVMVPHQYRTSEGYPGWMRAKHVKRVAKKRDASSVTVAYPVVSLRAGPSVDAPVVDQVYLASRLELHEKGLQASEGEQWFAVRGGDGPLWVRATQVTQEKPLRPEDGSRVVDLAKKFKGTPYLWGGMTRKGIDCSGLMYTCYRVNGITVPRDADQQFQIGTAVSKDGLEPGDMVFFGQTEEDITHVGMYAGDGMFVHASSGRGVVVSPLFEGWYLQHYQGARRVLDRKTLEPAVLTP